MFSFFHIIYSWMYFQVFLLEIQDCFVKRKWEWDLFMLGIKIRRRLIIIIYLFSKEDWARKNFNCLRFQEENQLEGWIHPKSFLKIFYGIIYLSLRKFFALKNLKIGLTMIKFVGSYEFHLLFFLWNNESKEKEFSFSKNFFRK